MSTSFQKGDDVKCTASFVDSNGSAIDPSTVRAQVKDPSGNIDAYLYGSDTALVRDSAGHYHVIVDADESGVWWYRFYSTGTGKAADESSFVVEESKF